MLKIAQKGPFEVRKKVKEMPGVSAFQDKSDRKWYYRINENEVDMEEIKPYISDADYQRILAERVIELEDFQDIFLDIADNIVVPRRRYSVVGDVSMVHTISDKTAMLSLIDEHNYRRTLSVVLNRAGQMVEMDLNDLQDKRVNVVGTLGVYQKYARVQLEEIEKVEVLGPCSRIAEYKEYEEQYKQYFKSIEEQKRLTFVPEQIGLISNKSIQGYHDFETHLGKEKFDEGKVIFKDVRMTVNNIIESIEKLNQANCQCICIVRGGGSPEDLMMFNDPSLLDAIIASKKLIITGVGHEKDSLLCDQVADYNAGTPTGAAEYLKGLWRKAYAVKKSNERKKANQAVWAKKRSLQEEYETLQQEYNTMEIEKLSLEMDNMNLVIEKEKLQAKLAEIEREQENLTAKKIVGKIFHNIGDLWECIINCVSKKSAV